MQPLGGGEFEEVRQVEAAVEAEGVGSWLVEVPGDVGLDGIEAHEPGLAQPVGPLLGVDPEVVQPAGQKPEGAAVEQETGLVCLENGHEGAAPVFGCGARCRGTSMFT